MDYRKDGGKERKTIFGGHHHHCNREVTQKKDTNRFIFSWIIKGKFKKKGKYIFKKKKEKKHENKQEK